MFIAPLLLFLPVLSIGTAAGSAPELDIDDECLEGEVTSCALSAIQLRRTKAIAQAETTAAPSSPSSAAADCHTANAEEDPDCYAAVRWTMSDGIFVHPDWYPGLGAMSSFEAVQESLHATNASVCPSLPCAPAFETCAQPVHGDACDEAVTFAKLDGIHAHPEWYPGLDAGSSSREEFQAIIHASNASLCPRPCVMDYLEYSVPTYRSNASLVMKGVSYGPSPLKKVGVLLTDDDFMSEITGVQWADWGRGDLQTLHQMGVNTLRMYGNDPNVTKRTFLDDAMRKGIDVIIGQSDYPFMQGPEPCMRKDWYCFDQVYEFYKLNLLNGLTMDGNSTYHPAFKAFILINEPDLKVHPRHLTCRAILTAFDAALEAEKDVGVTGNPIAFTATFSFGMFDGQAPGLGQMEDFYRCIQNPSAAPTLYTPRNDLLKAYKTRWVNSFNTANPAFSVKQLLLDRYARTFWNDELKLPVFIGEYHSVQFAVRQDLKDMLAATRSREYPFFMGFNFFEFSTRYDKGGTEMDFGMFGYGNCALGLMNYSGKVYNVWDLTLQKDMIGDPMPDAIADAYGGAVTSVGPILKSSPCVIPELQ
mmetsp:Transcript_124928/g.400189  ORF Transcript_124928/g.400189 Transcript_124928/m.400189 type:complete len:589 (-) Transcript_124928:20-1786(-)